MKQWNLLQFATTSRRLRAIATCLVGFVLVLIAAHPDSVAHGAAGSGKLALEVLRDFLREIGFALVVAIVIWFVFEYFARSENEAMWKERVQEVAENVFYAVHRRKIPPGYFNFANELILTPKFMRTGWQLHYSLRDAHYQENERKIPFVAVTCVSRFEVTNITEQTQLFPIQVSLPNPIHQGMKDRVGVSGILVWRSGQRQELELAVAEQSFRAQMQTNSFQFLFDAGAIEMQPQEKIEIASTFTLAKQVEDNEVLQGKYPADSLRIAIVDHCTKKRLIGARSIHPDTLEHESPAGTTDTYQYRINRYLLPHHGAVFWWKTV
jgi:hypothetical protein